MTVETDRFSSCQRRAVPSNQPQSNIRLEKQLQLHPNEAHRTDPDPLDSIALLCMLGDGQRGHRVMEK